MHPTSIEVGVQLFFDSRGTIVKASHFVGYRWESIYGGNHILYGKLETFL